MDQAVHYWVLFPIIGSTDGRVLGGTLKMKTTLANGTENKIENRTGGHGSSASRQNL